MTDSINIIAEESGLTPRKIARMFGIPTRTVEDWSAGRRNPPDYVYKLLRIALHLAPAPQK